MLFPSTKTIQIDQAPEKQTYRNGETHEKIQLFFERLGIGHQLGRGS